MDLIFTNMPEKVARSGIAVCSGSDHALIWMYRKTQATTKAPKKTMKRSFKHYNEADLKLAARMTDWGSEEEDVVRRLESMVNEEETRKRALEAMTVKLETNIRECMDVVAPMKIICLKKKRSA